MGDFLKKIKIIISVALFITSVFCFTTTSFAAQVDGKYVTLGGETFGVKFYNDGVIIVQLEDFYDGEKYVCPAKSSGLAVNDIIKKANGDDIKSNEDLQKTAYECNGEPISIEFERNGEILERKITPIHNTAGSYLLGAWVRDSCAGIGTITYYDTDNNYFAALGHGICDNDTNALLPLGFGEVVNANISSVTKSITGKAGSLNGYFTNDKIGNLTKNTDVGVFGTINSIINNKEKIEIADFDEIKVGKASIYTTINCDEIGCYDVEITKICTSDSESNENFVIKITSDKLLEECGGIVQGMSGSPIVQNGKLVGAVTHVFLNKTNEGYGVAIQNMVEHSVD